MITIIAKSVILDGMKERFKELISELITESRKENGCISYNLFEDMNNKNILTIIEEWEDEKSIENHNKSDHFNRIRPLLSKFREGSPQVELFKLIDDIE